VIIFISLLTADAEVTFDATVKITLRLYVDVAFAGAILT
jgi:hypothetical protein